MRYEINAAPKGQTLARYVAVKALSNGDTQMALALAEKYRDTPDVSLNIKAEVTPMTTSDTLVQYRVQSEYLDFERGFSVIGRLRQFMRPALFLTTTVEMTAAASVGWVSEQGEKPLTALALDAVALAPYKIVGHAVLTKELLRFSKPASERIVATALPKALARFLDSQFLDKSLTLSVGENPASITNGAGSVNSTGASAAQLVADLNDMTDALGSWVAPFWIMKPKTFSTLCAIVPTLIHIQGDNAYLMGIPVIRSTNSPASITLVDADSLLLADDGEASIGLSQHATVLMDDGVSPASVTTRSLWQSNLVALRCERRISWMRAYANAVVSMTVSY